VQNAANAKGSVLRARWQNPHPECRVLACMQRHTRLTNALPVEGPSTGASASLDPQQCFDKAMKTVAALKTGPENKKYSVSKL
jgi:hypothetical protein